MKYTFLLALLLTVVLSETTAQEIDWWKSFGAGSNETVTKVETDTKGNIIVLGTFDQIFDIDGNTLVIEGGQEFFLAKFNRTGKAIWVRTFTGVGVDQGADFAIDSQDVIYLVAYFNSKVRINDEVVFAEGGIDGLIMQISPDGFNGWIKNMGGVETSRALGVWVDATHVYAVGDFEDIGKMDDFIIESAGGTDIWMTKIEKSEAGIQWVKRFGGTGDDRLNAIVKDFRNDLYVCGVFSGTIDFGNTLTAGSGTDIFIGKLTDEGVPIWAKQASGASDNNEPFYMEVDEVANIYVSGVFENTLSFGDVSINAGTDTDGFLLSLNANGGFRWSQHTQTSGASRLNGLKQWNNRIFVAGTATNGTLFGTEVISDAQNDFALLAGFELDGQLQRVGYFDGPGNDSGIDLTGINETISMVGTYEQTLDFDGEIATAVGGSDIFLARVDVTTLTTDVVEIPQDYSLDFLVDQGNKSLKVTLPEDLLSAKGDLRVWNNQGRLLMSKKAGIQTSFDLSKLTTGIYYVQWSDGRSKVTSSFVLF